jgi:hypothetical protein
MKIKKNYIKIITIGVIVLLILMGWIFLRFAIGGSEDTWIKDSNGMWIKHGNPSEIPDYVLQQEEIRNCAVGKFDSFTGEINSQCLGTCQDYAVDIVHVPRSAEDNLNQNQCLEYVNGTVSHFIELDKNGDIVRIV